jgi:hypothetical protein
LLKSSLTGYESSLLLSGTCSLLLILPIWLLKLIGIWGFGLSYWGKNDGTWEELIVFVGT